MEDYSAARIKEIKKIIGNGVKDIDSLFTSIRSLKITKSPLERKLTLYAKEKNDIQLQSQILLKNQLKEILIHSEEINDLPEKILGLSSLEQFRSCHILVHEKGALIGQNYHYHTHGNKDHRPISLLKFNNVFSLIKKSKFKIFNQSLELKDDLDLVGNFLAKDIDLKNHSVIFLISRNSFLPPSENEQENFLLVTNFLRPIFIKFLEQKKNDDKKEILIRSLKNFPEKIYVKDGERIIFTNDPSEKIDPTISLLKVQTSGPSPLNIEISSMPSETLTAEIYHSQRVSLLGELLNTLQHELSNPLFGLNLTSDLLAGETNDPDSKEILYDISSNATRSQTIIKNFSNLYGDNQEQKKIHLLLLIKEVVLLTKSETKDVSKDIISLTPEDELVLYTSPTYLTQILFNLIINAAQALKSNPPGLKKIFISIKKIPSENYISIEICDNGPGIDAAIEDVIFSPFFTTKESGTGLGLAICKNLSRKLNGQLTFKNNFPSPGVTFTLNLPS